MIRRVGWLGNRTGRRSLPMPSTASEWLREHLEDLDKLGELMEAAGLPVEAWTDLPEWMKRNIAEQLRESFAQDYWDSIHEATLGDAERVLEHGLQEGYSVDRMAEEIAHSLQEDTRKYALIRGRLIARTEMGNALNGARRGVMDSLIDEIPELSEHMRPEWVSVLGTTTRRSHAALDGVPADEDGMWELAGVRVPWPGHWSLPPEERCNCQCSIVMSFGMDADEARRLVDEYQRRLEEEE